jgi:hypothetical protein
VNALEIRLPRPLRLYAVAFTVLRCVLLVTFAGVAAYHGSASAAFAILLLPFGALIGYRSSTLSGVTGPLFLVH